MRNILIILSLIIFFGDIDAKSDRSSSLITKDAKNLYTLITKLWSVSSIDLKKANQRMCQILLECCLPKTYSKVLLRTVWAANHSHDPFIEARTECLASPIRNDVLQTCPPAVPLNSSVSLPTSAVLNMSIYQKYQTIVEESTKLVSVLGDFHTRMAYLCNSKEIHAYLCTLNYRLLTSCMNKILRKYWNSHEKIVYPMYVKQLKTLMIYMHQIKEEFE